MKWIYTCKCGNRWTTNSSPVSFLACILISPWWAFRSKNWKPTLCPKCGKAPISGITEDGKQGCAHI